MIDNSIQIKQLLSFNENEFYFVQIIRRRKDNPELSNNNKIINSYYIDSLERFDKTIPRIVKLCTDNNARAYIHLNKRNYKKIALQVIKQVAEYIAAETYKPCEHVFNTVCGLFKSENNKTWILDIDYELTELEYTKLENILHSVDPVGAKIVCTIPTKQGVHVITKPFNVAQFVEHRFPVDDPHKDAPTLLFCP